MDSVHNMDGVDGFGKVEVEKNDGAAGRHRHH